MKKIFKIFCLFLFIISCENNSYDQNYKNYEDFKSIQNPRLSGWFPSIIKSDAYELKSISYLDKCAFGKFNYSNNSYYDSIFLNYPKVETSAFQQKVRQFENLKPSWFLDTDKFNAKDFEIVKDNQFNIARKKSTKEIYSFWTPDSADSNPKFK